MKYRTLIHCCDPNLLKPTIKLARKHHLSVKIYKHNPNALIIKGSKRHHNTFCNKLEDNPSYGIFYDHKHPRSAFYVYKPHYRLGNEVEINKTKTDFSMVPMSVYGRTPEWYRRMYQASSNHNKAPVIAVISLNNNYDPEDLRSYWTHVCGLSEIPNVINVLAGHKIKQRNTGLGVAYHNTLQLEILGALCPKATLLFISAPNTNTGLYQAFSNAIYGVKVNKMFYEPEFILCTWGTSELSLKSNLLNSFNNLFKEASDKNITIITSVGDNGYDDREVNFPASSPHVISVGGTTLLSDGKEHDWTWDPIFRWGTRNGPSSYFTTSKGTPRKVPDLSLNSDPNHGYTIFIDDKLILNGIGGTACSAALCTGFLASMDNI